jgi:penicillin-binding protein 2
MNSGGVLPGWLTVARVRIAELALLMLGASALLIRVLYVEQVESGEVHRVAVSRQSIRRVRIPAQRGRIFTADMVTVAENRPVLNLVFYPNEMRTGRRVKSITYMLDAAHRIATALGRPNPLNRRLIERHLNYSPGMPLVVFSDLDERELAIALESSRQLRGVDVESSSIRSYPLRDFAPHLIGFTRLESPREAADRKEFFYYIPDAVGRSGVEMHCDASPEPSVSGLRGVPGYKLNQVDHLGYVRQSMVDMQDPEHGNNVVLTLESRAQRLAERLLRGCRGAIVVLDADNGDVIAAATAPRYDLNRFSPVLSADYFEALHQDPAHPLLNRAFQGSYTPGSIMKPVVATALLKAGVDPAEQVDCTGYTAVGDATIRCAAYRRGGHGPTDLEHALEWSCNGYFNAMGIRVGDAELFRAFESAGIGRATGLGFGEANGIMPSYKLKRELYHYRWNRYDTALLSMGQGLVTVTPLQAAVFTAAFANGGTRWKPHLVRKIIDHNGRTLWERKVESIGKLLLTGDRLEPIRRGMFEVVNSDSGSGRRGRVENLEVFGKTGSAELGDRAHRRLITWFVAFTEYAKRRYAIAVMIEDGTSGGGDCAPLAAEFFQEYLHPAPQKKKE